MGWGVALLSEPSRGWPGPPSTPPTSLLCPIRHQSPPVSPCLLPGEASGSRVSVPPTQPTTSWDLEHSCGSRPGLAQDLGEGECGRTRGPRASPQRSEGSREGPEPWRVNRTQESCPSSSPSSPDGLLWNFIGWRSLTLGAGCGVGCFPGAARNKNFWESQTPPPLQGASGPGDRELRLATLELGTS